MRHLDFKEIHRQNKASVTRNKLRQRTVSPTKNSRLMKKKRSKATDVRYLSAEAEPTLTGMIAESVVFTAEEHLKAQQQIEQRAHALWCAGGCREGGALNN